MGGRSGSDKRKRSETVSARVEPEIKAAIQAVRGTQSESDWLRAVIVQSVNMEPDTRPRRKKAPPVLSAPANGELGELARAIAQATGKLKLTAQALRESGNHKLHVDTETTLAQMRTAGERVLALLPEGRK